MNSTLSRRAVLATASLAIPAWATATESANAKRWMEPGPHIPQVSLQDQDGRSHHLSHLLAGRPVAISFFFTGCTTFCPPQTAAFRDLQTILPQRAPRALLLSISLDPLADTPQALRAYAGRFGARLGLDERWMMLTGTPAALSPVWAAFDSVTGRPEDHLATLWVGASDRKRWARSTGLVAANLLANLLEASVV